MADLDIHRSDSARRPRHLPVARGEDLEREIQTEDAATILLRYAGRRARRASVR
jgi:hypothetical protein